MLTTRKAQDRLPKILGGIGIFVLGVLAIIASGGGGGGGTTSGIPSNPLQITSTNAVEVATNAVSVVEITDLASVYMLYPYGVSLTTQQQAQGRFRNIVEHVKASLNLITQSSVASAPQGIHVQIENMCDSGSVTFDWNDVNSNDLLSAGETLQLTFNACHDATYNFTENGKTTVTVNSISGDPQNDAVNWSVNISATDENYSYEDAEGKYTYNGTITITATNNATANTRLLKLEGTSYSVSGDGYAGRLTNFMLSTLLNLTLGTYELDADYTLADTDLGGVITVVTNPVFSGLYNSGTEEIGNPTAGKMTITGASGATVTIEPYDDQNALISLDADGDGTFENTWQVLWTTL